MKKIWILNHYAVPPELGAGVRHYKFAENLIRKGYEVKIFAASTIHNTDKNLITNSNKYLYKEFNGVPFIFIKACGYMGNGKKRIKNMIDYAVGIMKVSKEFATEKPDVIYASSVHPLTWISGYRLAKRYNAKFIAETRDLWPETLISMGKISKKSIIAKVLYKLEKYIYQKADKIIFTIPGGRDYIEHIKLDASKASYINNGIDLEEFKENEMQYKYVDVDLDNNIKFKVIYTGSMGIANSLDYLIEAAEIIQKSGNKDIEFILFGDGYQKEKLQQYVINKKINNVIFKGKVDKKYIPNILSKSSLNIFTGKNIDLYKYGLSLNKMFDYFASGKPTLSNIQCGYDLLEQYNCGITAQGAGAETVAEAILKFYHMPPKEYQGYCNNARGAALDFDFKILTNKLEDLIIKD